MTSTLHIPFTQLSSLPTYTGASTSRLQSLYSDISRQKQSNPTSYHSNVAWWRSTLEAVVARGWQPSSPDKLILHAVAGLPDALRYEGTAKPLCLGTVITELSSSRALVPHAQFLASAKSVYDPGWLPYRIVSYVIGKPLWWALQQAGVVSSESDERESDRWRRMRGDYVVLSLVEKAAEAVVARQRSRAGAALADALYSAESFRAEFADKALAGVVLSDADVKVLIRFLERDKQVVVVDKEVIKFLDDFTDVREVTSVDCGILELKTAIANLSAQVDTIQSRIDAQTSRATAALRQTRQGFALSCIRARKQLESVLKQRLGSLETLQSTLIRVEAAAGDIQIMKTYESSTATLRALLADPSLQRDMMDRTFDALAAATADAHTVDEALQVGGDMARAEAGTEIDEDELERELAALVAEGEREKMEKAEREAVERRQREEEERRVEGLASRIEALKVGVEKQGVAEPEAA